MAKPRELHTLLRQTYKDGISKEIGNEEFTQIIKNFIQEYSRMYFNSVTKNSKNTKEVTINVSDNDLSVFAGDQSVANIIFTKNLASGEMNQSTSNSKMKNLMQLMDDLGVELEINGMVINNTIDEENKSNGFSVVAEEKAPTIKQAIEYSMSKLPDDVQEAMYYDSEVMDGPSEYSINLAQRKTLVTNLESLLKVDTKSSKTLDSRIKMQSINNYIDKISIARGKAIEYETELMRENVEDNANYSVPEMLVLMNPSIIQKDNVLKNKFDENGTLLEFDVLMEKEEKILK